MVLPIADVPVGLFLSGGVDSSAVASIMAGLTDLPVRAYSIGFDVAEHSETSYATLVAERLGLEHTVRTVGVGGRARGARARRQHARRAAG